MATSKRSSKASAGTGKGARDAEIDVSAAANDGEEEGAKAPGDPSQQQVNVGADSLPNATRAAPQARPVELDPKKSKKIYLDQVYTLHGRHYGPSAHPHDLIQVPEDFPDHILPNGGQAPELDEWARNRPPASNVIDVTDESGKVL